MSNYTKGAKDLAFDKERIKFRKEINRLTETINRNDDYIVTLQRTIKSRDSEIEQLKDWINRMLEYCNMSKEDLQKIISNAEKESDVLEKLGVFTKYLGKFSL